MKIFVQNLTGSIASVEITSVVNPQYIGIVERTILARIKEEFH
ncbi:MAG: hypothetical protein WCJ54_02620 [Actinomycetota bacterium]